MASKYAAQAKAGYTVDSLTQQLDDMTLRAPRAGVVTYRNAEVGAMAAANTKVLTITDTSGMYIDCSLSEADVAAIQQGMPVSVSIESLAQDYDGYILIKGGHSMNRADDLLVHKDEAHWLSSEKIDNPNTHGTGCTLSSAIAGNLALGYDMISAVERAKAFISGALRDGLDLGQGSGPLNHCWNIKQKQPL